MGNERKWGEDTKYLAPAHHAFSGGKSIDLYQYRKVFGLSKVHNHSRNIEF